MSAAEDLPPEAEPEPEPEPRPVLQPVPDLPPKRENWWRRWSKWMDDEFPREPEDNLPDR